MESWASKGTSGSHSWRVTREDQEKGEVRKGMSALRRTYWAAAARMVAKGVAEADCRSCSRKESGEVVTSRGRRGEGFPDRAERLVRVMVSRESPS